MLRVGASEHEGSWISRSSIGLLGSDLHELIEAMMKPLNWPRYRIILHRINVLCSSFVSVAFEESTKSNRIAREIGKSVLQGGWFHSYLALRGPAWLHVKVQEWSVTESNTYKYNALFISQNTTTRLQ